jgi:hypothetical protein
MDRVEQRIARNAKRVQEKSGGSSDDDSEHDYMDEEEEKDYFDVVVDKNGSKDALMFSQLNLSRPFLRAIEAMGYTHPTPIQAQVIPYALAGRDICASAVTGSGKTGGNHRVVNVVCATLLRSTKGFCTSYTLNPVLTSALLCMHL